MRLHVRCKVKNKNTVCITVMKIGGIYAFLVHQVIILFPPPLMLLSWRRLRKSCTHAVHQIKPVLTANCGMDVC